MSYIAYPPHREIKPPLPPEKAIVLEGSTQSGSCETVESSSVRSVLTCASSLRPGSASNMKRATGIVPWADVDLGREMLAANGKFTKLNFRCKRI